MGRKKAISDSDLIRLLDLFINEECYKATNRCTIPEFSLYLKKKGYPVEAYVLRRNPIIKDRFEEIKKNSKSADYIKLVSYKTLDAKAFVEANRGDKAMILALTQLDSKTKSICDTAVKYIQEGASYLKKIESLEREVQLKSITLKTIENKLSTVSKERDELKSQVDTYKCFINTYVYPEAANEILAGMGLLFETPEIVSKDVINDDMFKGTDSTIPMNNVIAGLFNRFED